MRAALYARVSSPEQLEGYSIDAQRRAFRLLCQGRQWEPVAEYVDEGKTARTDKLSKRPAFRQALADAQAHIYDVLVVHKLDRFSRNLRITLESFDVLGKAGVAFVSVTEQMDFTSPYGRFALSMLGALAELYSDNLSQETKKGKGERKEQGLYNGLLPFGVMKGPDKIPLPNPDTYLGLVMAYELAAQGKTDREIAQGLNAKGYRTAGNRGNGPFSKHTVRDMLPNRFYLGELPDGNGGWMKGKHQALIPQELFDQAQQTRERNREAPINHPAKATISSFTGLGHCWYCKGRIHTGSTKNGKKRLMCANRVQGKGCQQKSALLEVYEAQLEAYLENFHIPEDYQERLLREQRKLEVAYDDTQKRRTELEGRLERIKKLFTWGDIAEPDYLAQKETIQRELRSLEPPKDQKVLEQLAAFLKNVSLAWREASQEQRNRLNRQLFEEIWLTDKQVFAVKPRPELKPFFQFSFEEWRKKFESVAPTGSGVPLRDTKGGPREGKALPGGGSRGCPPGTMLIAPSPWTGRGGKGVRVIRGRCHKGGQA